MAVPVMTTSCCELWRDIPGWEGLYQVSNLGGIRNWKGDLLKPFLSRNGYLVATLYRNGQKTRTGVHRLIASAFIPNPEGKEQTNHKNGIKTDNRVENLEWATCSENNLHRRRVLHGGGGRKERPVVCLTTGERFRSITEASRRTGSDLCRILVCCQGKRKHTNGLAWAYAEEVSS
jgi:hypothetical protein